MQRRIATGVVVLLAIAAGIMGFGLANKMRDTAVSAQPMQPVPVAPTEDSAASREQVPVAVFIGDFTSGTDAGGEGDKNWTSIVAAGAEKFMPLRTAVVGEGSGYVLRGAAPTFADQVRRVVQPDARVVVISGSRNDVLTNPNEVTAAALETFKLVHTLAPRAALIVIGPSWATFEPSPEVLRTRDAVREAAILSNAYWVDPIDLGWFTTGEPGLIGPDNVHPTDLANVRIAEHMSQLFNRVLLDGTRQ